MDLDGFRPHVQGGVANIGDRTWKGPSSLVVGQAIACVVRWQAIACGVGRAIALEGSAVPNNRLCTSWLGKLSLAQAIGC